MTPHFLSNILYRDDKNFLILTLSAHMTLIGILLINIDGVDLTILRQIVGFAYSYIHTWCAFP